MDSNSNHNFFLTFFWDKYFSIGFTLGLAFQPLEIMDLMFSTRAVAIMNETTNWKLELETEDEQFGWKDLYESSIFIWFLSTWFIIGTFTYFRTIDVLLKLIFYLIDTKYDIQLAAINEILFGLWFAGKIVSTWVIFQDNRICISRQDCQTPFFHLLIILMNSVCCGGPENHPCGIFSSDEFSFLHSYYPPSYCNSNYTTSCQQLFEEYVPGISISFFSGVIVSLFYNIFTTTDSTDDED